MESAIIHGILIGGIYGGIALGLSVIFGVIRIINFAHGSFLMLPMYVCFFLWKFFALPPYITFIFVGPVFYFLGYGAYKLFIAPLFKREKSMVVEPVSALLLTCGLWLVLDNMALMIFGPNFFKLQNTLSGHTLHIGETVIETPRLLALIVGLVLAFIVNWFLTKTEAGRAIRAISQNREAGSLCGIPVYNYFAMTFGIGTAIVAIMGAFMTQFYYISPNLGLTFGVKSFLIVVMGGLGSIPGALIGGLIFGLIESIASQFVPLTSATIFSFIVFILVLVLRPQGLMGSSS